MTQPEPLQLLEPVWPCPANVRAVISTRRGGVSQAPYASANLGDHVGDDPTAVARNRDFLAQQIGVQQWPWLQQIHGVAVQRISGKLQQGVCADAVYTSQPGIACAVLTADCLPILLCDVTGTQVAAAHAGWRGLAAGVIQNTVTEFSSPPVELMAYLGPAIGPRHFEVGEDVYRAFAQLFEKAGADMEWRESFRPSNRPGHFYANLYGLARCVLQQLGVQQVFGGDFCTYADAERFYSYRRDGVTGRMVSAIWLQP
jgi:uncharacterized protein, YfiH family